MGAEVITLQGPEPMEIHSPPRGIPAPPRRRAGEMNPLPGFATGVRQGH